MIITASPRQAIARMSYATLTNIIYRYRSVMGCRHHPRCEVARRSICPAAEYVRVMRRLQGE
jgi:hypothetical protein